MQILSVYIDASLPDQPLDAIASYLNSFNAGIRADERLWFVKTAKLPKQVCDEINALSIPEGYQLFIFEVGDKWTTHCAKSEVNSWMGKHI